MSRRSSSWVGLNDLAERLRVPRPQLLCRLAAAGLWDEAAARPTDEALVD